MWLTITSAITSTLCRQRAHVAPVAQARVDLGVVDGVEAGVGAVDGVEEGQQVHAAEHARPAGRRSSALQVGQAAAAQAVDVGDELDLVLHAMRSAACRRRRAGLASQL